MQLDAFLLADAVSAPPDGKFYIHGGGLTRITTPTMPFLLPQLGVFARFEVTEQELRRGHRFRLALTDPDSQPMGALPEFDSAPIKPPRLEPGERRFVALAINVSGLLFARTGLFHFELYVDDERHEAMPLPVVTLTAEELQAMTRPKAPAVAPNRAQRRTQQRRR